MTATLSRSALIFAAGFIAVMLFHQAIWLLLTTTGIFPPDPPAWAMAPVPPFGVPYIISKAIWGGLWALLLFTFLGRLTGSSYWLWWTVIGAVALSLVALLVVPPLKGQPLPQFMPRFLYACALNAAWGAGTALFLRLFGVTKP